MGFDQQQKFGNDTGNAVARRGGGETRGRLRPKPRGIFPSRMLMGAPPPDTRWDSALTPIGASPQTPFSMGSGGGTSGGLGPSPQQPSFGEAAPGFGAEPQPPSPPPPLATALLRIQTSA